MVAVSTVPPGGGTTFPTYSTGVVSPPMTYGGSSGDPTVAYVQQNAYFTRIGNLVTVVAEFQTSSVSGGSGLLKIEGLPFAARAGRFVGTVEVGFANGFAATVPSGGYVEGGATDAYLTYDSGTTGHAEVPITALGASSANSLVVTIKYLAA